MQRLEQSVGISFFVPNQILEKKSIFEFKTEIDSSRVKLANQDEDLKLIRRCSDVDFKKYG